MAEEKEWKPPAYYKEVPLAQASEFAKKDLFRLRWGPNGKVYLVDYENPDYKKRAEERTAKKKERAQVKRTLAKKRANKRKEKFAKRLEAIKERAYKKGLRDGKKNAVDEVKSLKKKQRLELAIERENRKHAEKLARLKADVKKKPAMVTEPKEVSKEEKTD